MRILIIDDIELRHEKLAQQYIGCDIVHVYNYHDAITALSNQFDLISFDHDLECFVDGNEKTGADIAKWMAYNEAKVSKVIVHSQNQIGAKNIASILKSGDVCCDIIFEPFGFHPGLTWGK